MAQASEARARLVEIINREPEGSERQIVLYVNGATPLTVDPGRSLLLTVEESGQYFYIDRKRKAAPTDLPEELKAVVERDQAEQAADEVFFEGVQWTPEQLKDFVIYNGKLINRHETTRIDDSTDLNIELGSLPATPILPATPENLEALQAELDAENARIAALNEQIEAAAPTNPLPIWTREALEDKSFAELRELAHSLNIKVRGKEEAVREILAATGASV